MKETKAKIIATSNIPAFENADFKLNFSSFAGNNDEVYGNTGLMSIRFLQRMDVASIFIAGMDGYDDTINYYDIGFDTFGSKNKDFLNESFSKGLSELNNKIKIKFITPTLYKV